MLGQAKQTGNGIPLSTLGKLYSKTPVFVKDVPVGLFVVFIILNMLSENLSSRFPISKEKYKLSRKSWLV